MSFAESGLVIFVDLVVPVDGVALMVTAIGYFAHGKTGCVHQVPFGMPRDFPAAHARDTSP